MKNVLRTQHAVSLAAAGLLLVIALVVAVVTASRMDESVAWVNQSYYVMSEVRRVVSLLKDAETDQRGFIIVGDEAYAAAFEETATELSRAEINLATALADNPRQLERAATLRRMMDKRLGQLRDTIRVRREGGIELARAIILQEAALRPSMEVRKLEGEMVAEEIALLDIRGARMRSGLRMAGITVAVSGALALGMGLHTFILMRRALRALRRETELLRAKERAERADREKSEFLANMSHEIRTPMNAVLGFAELLRDAATTAKQREYVGAIHASGRALLALINDILDLSKIEAGKVEVTLQPVSVPVLIEGIRTIFDHEAEKRGLRLACDVDPGMPPSLLFDATRLRQILFNVVGNALKFTRQGSITVRAWAQLTPGDETTVTLCVSVTDTGIGIPLEHHQFIFEPFRQVRTEGDDHPGGTGLGLSITQRLVKVLGGEVHLKSAPDNGSVFTFSFPRVQLSALRPKDEVPLDAEQDFGMLRPATILVADDVPLNCAMVEEFFSGTHHRILVAPSGRDAVALARAHRPDLVLMDVRMPDVDGRKARAEMRADATLAHIPVVAMTASNLLADEGELRELFDGYIRKPFTRAALFQELARHLDRATSAFAPDALRARGAPEPAVEPVPAGEVEAWRELLEGLRALERETWPALVRTMGFREMEAFAQGLVTAAEKARCGVVRDYAGQLLVEVRRFEIAAQERSLREFPALVARLAQSLGAVA